MNETAGGTGRLPERLRQAVLPVHQRIEALPFFTSLSRRALPVERYVDQLRAMAIVYAAVERALETSEDRSARTAWSAATPRLGLLLADLAFFDTRGPLPDAPGSTGAALAAAKAVLLCALQPHRLVGHLYVFQGMALGNATHLEDARAAAGGVAGAAWYEGLGAGTGVQWSAFCRCLETLGLGPEEEREVVDGALEAVNAQEAIHALLDPALPVSRRVLATTLNVEAGSHAVPEDPDLLVAALRAGARCLAEFPYFNDRWGERGERYTRSDVAWLMELARLERAEALGQVRWLAGVLARRGMPSLLLERQLELLAEELPAGEVSAASEFFVTAAEHLRETRRGALPDDRAARLASTFESATGFGSAATRREAARLLLAALADETSGFPGAAEAVATWYRGPRFPDEWRKAVGDLLRSPFSGSRAGRSEG